MWLNLKKAISFFLLTLCLASPLQAALFGLSMKDKKAYQHARNIYNSGNYTAAVKELTDYIYQTEARKHREARAYRLLGLSYQHLGMLSKALEVYLEALEFHPGNPSLLLAAAALYQQTNLTDRSIELYAQVLKREPDNLEALSGQAQNYVNLGFYSQARRYYEHFFELNPKAPHVNRARYAYTFLQQRDYENAFINITMAKREQPEDPSYWWLSAKAYKGLGKTQDALADLNTAILLAPKRSDLVALKALWLYQSGHHAQSLELSRQLLAQDPNNELALFIGYLNYMHTARPEQGLWQLQKINQLGSGSFINRMSEKILHSKQAPSANIDLSFI